MATATQPLRARSTPAPPRPRISTHLELVGPKTARDICQDECYPQQRPVRPWHVEYLHGVMQAGDLRPGTLISFARVGNHGPRFLINGHHTLLALGQYGGGPLWLQVETIVAKDMDEVGRLYDTYDRNLARSLADLYRTDPSLSASELGAAAITKLGSAISVLADGFQQHIGFRRAAGANTLRNARIRKALMNDWHEEMFSLTNGLRVGTRETRRYMKRAAVLAVALVTYRFQPEQAHLFWPRVVRDSGLNEGQPEHALLRYMRETPAVKADVASYARITASAWNAAFERRGMYKVHGRQPRQPFLLAGTPHDGQRVYAYLGPQGEIWHTPRPVEPLS